MSLFNTLFGDAPDGDLLLTLLGTERAKIPRYRYCLWDGKHIVIHTRTGGGNRDWYESEKACRSNFPEAFEEDVQPPTGPWNSDLRAIPGYVRDEDDAFDCTYADFYFKPPAAALEALKQLPKGTAPATMWQELFTALKAGKSKPPPAPPAS